MLYVVNLVHEMKINVGLSHVTNELKDKYEYVIGRGLDDSRTIFEIEEDDLITVLKGLLYKFGNSAFLDTYGRLYISYHRLERDDRELLFRSTTSDEYKIAWNRILKESEQYTCNIM